MFACEDLGYQPDIITFAKGLTSGYSPLGGMVATDRLFEPFVQGPRSVDRAEGGLGLGLTTGNLASLAARAERPWRDRKSVV